jgi:hypothetical protein
MSAGPLSSGPRPVGIRLSYAALVMVFPQQQVGLFWPEQVGGAALVTVSSHPQFGSGHR